MLADPDGSERTEEEPALTPELNGMEARGMTALETNSFLYEVLLDSVRRLARRDDSRLLSFVESVAFAALRYHPGRFSDGALENVVLRAGTRLESSRAGAPTRPPARKRTLHVASFVHAVGGHSRFLAKWIQRDLGSDHGVALTWQRRSDAPSLLTRICGERDVPILDLSPAHTSITDRARQLRSLSREYDRVILHTHPHDTTPVLAYATAGGPPVAMFNHAHFHFCLGSTVSDVIVNTLPYFREVTIRHRFPKATAIVTGSLALEPLARTPVDRAAARTALGLPPVAPVAMTIGAEQYFKPMNGYDFFATMEKVLRVHPDLHLLFVGVGDACPFVPARLKAMNRVRFYGRVPDPTLHYQASDLCLESFPVPSLAGLGEAVAYGEAFPVPMYGSGETILRVDQEPFLKYEFRPPDEAAYVDYVGQLLHSPDATRAKARAARAVLVELDESFADQFPELYRRLDATEHQPTEIPATRCSRERDSEIMAALEVADVGAVLDDLLHFGPAIAGHIKAALGGYETKREAMARIGRRAGSAVRRVVTGLKHRSAAA
jgi:hypothetical protein